jgi:hypothetical protein
MFNAFNYRDSQTFFCNLLEMWDSRLGCPAERCSAGRRTQQFRAEEANPVPFVDTIEYHPENLPHVHSFSTISTSSL